MAAQITQHILMVRPAAFSFNPETAGSNAFQTNSRTMTAEEIKFRAIEEFDGFVARLRAKGINILVCADSDQPAKPDAVFPNNWVTFHDDGTVVTYPMCAPVRRLERQESVLRQVEQYFHIKKRVHLETAESENKFLEGTGSLVIDRANKIVYACLSVRTDTKILEKFAQLFDYQIISFLATDEKEQEIYHTNVMMALGETFVIVCLETVKDLAEREKLLAAFKKTDKEVIAISLDQMKFFAGNMLQVAGDTGATYLVMSERAFNSLSPEQIERIDEHTNFLYAPLSTIETYGGGSARCMMAEIFLEEKI